MTTTTPMARRRAVLARGGDIFEVASRESACDEVVGGGGGWKRRGEGRERSVVCWGLVSGVEQERLCEVAWPSGLRRRFKAPVRKGVGSNPTAAKSTFPSSPPTHLAWHTTLLITTLTARSHLNGFGLLLAPLYHRVFSHLATGCLCCCAALCSPPHRHCGKSLVLPPRMHRQWSGGVLGRCLHA